MGLFRRVGDIVSANLNELLDGVENPEVMLKQAVREMEAALSSAMDSAARVIANERLLDRQLAEHRGHLERWRNEATSSVRAGVDERARAALVRKTEQQKLVEALEDQRIAAAETSGRLRRQIEAMRVRLGEAQAKLVQVCARRQAVRAQKEFASRLCSAGAFGRFERMCLRVDRAEAEADALLELSRTFDAIDDFDFSVEDELIALKQQFAKAADAGSSTLQEA
jgi:phage shock protein A